MAQQDCDITLAISLDDKPARHFSKWWFVILALPFEFILQIALNTTFSHAHNRAAFLAALIIDVVIFMRAVVGLIWQPHSSDWELYFLLLLLSVPLVMLVALFGGLVDAIVSANFVTSSSR